MDIPQILHYIIQGMWLSISLDGVGCQTTSFKPVQRRSHTATLIDDKLYILGGRNEAYDIKIGTEFFYIDFSVPFNTQNILWHDLTSVNTVPAHFAAASVNGGANNKTLFLYGGIPYNEGMSLVYAFDTRSSSWAPEISSVSIIRKDSLQGIVDFNGKMYLFGGQSKSIPVNDMFILDTINLNWEIGSSINAPSPRAGYGASLLSNDLIIYL
ncbi:6222_t:CDS:2, partial [Funneliformis geosporum]